MDSENLPTPALILKSNTPGINKISPIASIPFLIGRSVEACLKLPMISISRKQCTIDKICGRFVIKSLNPRTTLLNGVGLDILDSPIFLKCSDIIELPGLVKFEFKCSPNSNGFCCENSNPIDDSVCLIESDSIVTTNSGKSFGNNDSSQTMLSKREISESFMPALRSFQLSNAEEPPNVDSIAALPLASKFPGIRSSDCRLLLNIDLLTSTVLTFVKSVEQNKSKEPFQNFNGGEVINELKLRLECFDFLEKYCIDESCNAHERKGNVNNLIEAVEKLSAILGEKRLCIQSSEESIKNVLLKLDVMILNKLKGIVTSISTLPGNSLTEPSSDFYAFSSNSRSSRLCSCKKQTKTILSLNQREDQSNVEVNENDHNVKILPQEAKIQYLQMKLQEKENLANELETAREENDQLQTKISEMKRGLAEKEVMELELKYLQESAKYREDDKRSKDVLQDQINRLEADNKKLMADLEQMKNKTNELTDNYTKLEEKFNNRVNELMPSVSCTAANDVEFCYDMMRDVKASLIIDLLEREFNCSICGDVLVEATVTNCNHVFCAHCLQEWKKMKRDCPFCRSILRYECKAAVFDEYITNLLKLISEKMLAERLKLIEERKKAAEQPPPPKRARSTGSRRAVSSRVSRRNRTQQNQARPALYDIDPRTGFPQGMLEEVLSHYYL